MSASGYFEHVAWGESKEPGKPWQAPERRSRAGHTSKQPTLAAKANYCWPRIWKERLAKGVRVGEDRIRKLMKVHGIRAWGTRRHVVTTDRKHNLPIAVKLLDRHFQPEQPNAVWTSDILTTSAPLRVACSGPL